MNKQKKESTTIVLPKNGVLRIDLASEENMFGIFVFLFLNTKYLPCNM